MTHQWSLPMWIMSLASASLMCFKCLLFVCKKSICFSLLLEHQPAFQPVTSFVSIVKSVSANTFTFRSFSRSQLSIEVFSNDGYVFVTVRHVFLDCFVHLLNVVVRIFCVGKVHTHQVHVLSVHQDRSSDGTFVDVLCVDDSLPTFCSTLFRLRVCCRIFQIHENVFMVSPIFQLVLVSTFHSFKIASHL